jgi:hypothetical protein
MRYRLIGLTIFCCCAFLAGVALRSQSVPPRQRPYVAVLKKTLYTADPGRPEVVKEIVRTTEARDTQGRRYTSAGEHIPPSFRYDWIRDVVAGRSYRVNRQQKLAYFTRLDATNSLDLSKSEMQEVEINGVRCFQGPLRKASPDGGIEVMGTLCVSAELGNLVVHNDHKANFGGEDVRIVSELEHLQWDTEPPPDWFQIPGDFRLIPGHPGKPASGN